MASHLGARKDGKFKAVSTAPSFNKTPVGSSTPPLPYPVTEDLSSSLGTVPNVRFNGDPAYVLNQSTQPGCKGDAAGSCKGVKSGTVSGEVKPVRGSSTVRIAGKPVIREGDPCTLNGGNCPGIYVTQSAPGASIEGGTPSASGNPPVRPETPKEESWWGTASPWVHGVLGVASFVPGLSVVTGAVDAGIYAAEGDMVEAGLSAASMIPGGKVVTTAGKLAKGAVGLAKGAHVAEDAAKAAKLVKEAEEAARAAKVAREAEEAAKLKKAEEEAARLRKAEDDANAAREGRDGKKVKGKKKLKCGEYGKYGDLKKKTGDGTFDRDHIPSKAALKERAESLLDEGEKLSPTQRKAIEDWGDSIAIPRQAHVDVSPTYGTKNIKLAPQDAKDLAGAARRDVESMLGKIDEYDADGGCKKAYQKAAKRVLRMTNKDFDKALLEIIKKVK
ncbi:PAAR-like domain-containing protein [Paraburkholderia kururiensis]|uniref:PAAR-like domain-containing protein n=1 Tax=Paraburkholderia kururiensis TaxID=984307 RepID=A0ABZ0WNU2_9BURK|nr:PAAR-like domain-containing protein [Paraburkholderia kururiensis]WQD79033.1 PAAR-like domain-containing protein [Paraburkholderia kururiensis]